MTILPRSATALLAFLACASCSARPSETDLTERAREITRSLSLEAKVGQLLHIGFPGTKLSEPVRAAIARVRPGGVILFGHNLTSGEQIRALNADLQKASIEATGIPLLISTDQEGGRVFRVPEDVMPVFPGAMGLGQSGDEALARDVGFSTGYHLRAAGIDLVLAPVLDVNNNPDNPVINTRSFGSDPATVSRMAGALALGIRESGAIPVIKHFPGHGDTNVDSHLDLPHIDRTQAELERVELPPFQEAIRSGAEVVMTAHILFPKLDPERPATLSGRILGDILRKKLAFRGLIMTDAMEMHAVARRYPYEKSSRMAVEAGVDVVLLTGLGSYVDTMYRSLVEAFQKGELPMELLDRAVERQIRLKLERSLFVRHAGSRPAPTERERMWAAEQEVLIEKRRADLERKYAALGTTLPQYAARASIASLRKAFPGAVVPVKSARVFALSSLIVGEATGLGVPKARISLGGSGGALRAMKRAEPGAVWVIEVRQSNLAGWNALVRTADALPAAPLLIALYPDSPFREIRVPKKGFVLASFAPTRESRRALLVRALGATPIPMATVTLPPIAQR